MTGKVLRDRSALPALDSLMERTMDVQQSRLAATLWAGFRARGRRPERLRALIGLALDSWTWHRLNVRISTMARRPSSWLTSSLQQLSRLHSVRIKRAMFGL